jgi:mannose/cellobiose epimerase-like protein (N-acyl-D-glucosamine 2-epimerase family)
MTEDEKKLYQQNNPNMQKVQAATAVEQVRGKNKLQEVAAKGKTDLVKTIAEKALDKMAGGAELELAAGRMERNDDQAALENGLPGNPSA